MQSGAKINVIVNISEECGMERKPTISPEIQEAIRKRAGEIYQRSGQAKGHDLENWYQAEAEVLREVSHRALRQARPAVVVNVAGVLYTGEYDQSAADGYRAGEWNAGDPVPVRLAGDKLYLLRPNGKELATTIVRRLG
jgi:Protein of unknown function (DUF2934)